MAHGRRRRAVTIGRRDDLLAARHDARVVLLNLEPVRLRARLDAEDGGERAVEGEHLAVVFQLQLVLFDVSCDGARDIGARHGCRDRVRGAFVLVQERDQRRAHEDRGREAHATLRLAAAAGRGLRATCSAASRLLDDWLDVAIEVLCDADKFLDLGEDLRGDRRLGRVRSIDLHLSGCGRCGRHREGGFGKCDRLVRRRPRGDRHPL